MAKHVLGELYLSSAKFASKIAKRPRNDVDDVVKPTDKQSVLDTAAAAAKCRHDATVADDVPQSISSNQPLPRTNCIVTRSEMMAYFSLLGSVVGL